MSSPSPSPSSLFHFILLNCTLPLTVSILLYIPCYLLFSSYFLSTLFTFKSLKGKSIPYHSFTSSSLQDDSQYCPNYLVFFRLPSSFLNFCPCFLSFFFTYFPSFLLTFLPSYLPSFLLTFLPSFVPCFLPSFYP